MTYAKIALILLTMIPVLYGAQPEDPTRLTSPGQKIRCLAPAKDLGEAIGHIARAARHGMFLEITKLHETLGGKEIPVAVDKDPTFEEIEKAVVTAIYDYVSHWQRIGPRNRAQLGLSQMFYQKQAIIDVIFENSSLSTREPGTTN